MIKFQDGIELYTEAEFPPTLTIDELKEFAKKKILPILVSISNLYSKTDDILSMKRKMD